MAGSNAGRLHARWPRAGSTSVSRTTAETVVLKQPFGKRSRQSLADLCAAKPARVEWTEKDRNGRLLARVWCSGIDANAEQVRRGMAWVFDRYVKDGSLYPLQDRARAQRLGRESFSYLWGAGSIPFALYAVAAAGAVTNLIKSAAAFGSFALLPTAAAKTL